MDYRTEYDERKVIKTMNYNYLTPIKFKKLNPKAIVPTQAHPGDAGMDLYACIESPVVIAPHKTVKIGTGLAFALPQNTFGAIFARSGLATKNGVRPSNCVGVCDLAYRNEYIVALHNDSDEPYTVNPNERIAQLIIMPYIPSQLVEVAELDKTERGMGGFGSSGK